MSTTDTTTATATAITTTTASAPAQAASTGRRRTRRQRIAAGAAGLLALGALATAVAPAASAAPGQSSGGSGTTTSSSTTGTSAKGAKESSAVRSVNKAYAVAGASLLSIETTYSGVIRDNTGATVNEGKALALRTGCTAFSVSSDGYLVTAGHCVDPDGGAAKLIKAAAAVEAKSGTWTVGERAATVEELTEYGAEHWTVDADVSVRVQLPESSEAGSRDDDDMVGARVLTYKPFEEEDVALLKVGAEHLPVLELAVDQELREGDEVVSAGFASTSAANTDADTPTFKDGTISSKRTEGNGKMPVLETSASLNPGMSGGPTVDDQGRVVGVNSGAVQSAQAFNYVRPASLINEMLRREGVDNTLADADVAFREAIDAYNDGDHSAAVTKLDEVLEAWPGNEAATRLRDDAVKAGGTAGGSTRDSQRGTTSADSVPGVITAAGTAATGSTSGSDTGVVLLGGALIVLVAAGGITVVLLVARRSGSAGRPAAPGMATGPVPAFSTAPAPVAPAPVASAPAPVVTVPGAMAAQAPAFDPYRTDEIPVVHGAAVTGSTV